MDNRKELRKLIGLPKTKPLVYYPDKRDASSKTEVVDFWVEKVFDEDENNVWYGVTVLLPDGTEKRLHSAYFAMMQKKSFVDDILEEERSN